MHTMIVNSQMGQIRIHHNSDWSGDVEIVCPNGRTESLPGFAAKAMLWWAAKPTLVEVFYNAGGRAETR